jgi:hypothetical protein
LADGKLLWDKLLVGPRVPYHTRRLRDCLLTYPVTSSSTRIQFRFLWGSVQWEQSAGCDSGAGLGYAVLCSDPKTGQVIERMNLSPSPPRGSLHVRATRVTIQPRLEIGPVESDGEKPVVQLSARGIIVALANGVWCFTAAENNGHR